MDLIIKLFVSGLIVYFASLSLSIFSTGDRFARTVDYGIIASFFLIVAGTAAWFFATILR